MHKQKLTVGVLNKALRGSAPGETIWDTVVSGFHIRKNQNNLSFRLKYRNDTGTQRILTIGRYPSITVEEARRMARELAGRSASGEDPQQTKFERRQQEQIQAVRTLGGFLDGRYEAYQNGKKRSGAHTMGIIRKHFSCFFSVSMDQITAKSIDAWQVEKEAEGLAFATILRSYGALKTCLNYAVKEGAIKEHQLNKHKLEKPHLTEQDLAKSGTARRYLTDKETEGFFKGLAAYQEKKRQERRNSRAHGKARLMDLDSVKYVDHVVPWLLTMFYTGLRPGDIFGLRWEQVDLSIRTITKTIEKTAHHHPEPMKFPISKSLIEVLTDWHKQCGRPSGGYVFPSERLKGGRMDKKAMQKPWKKVQELGGVSEELQLYTLRHNFASQLILSGADLLTVSKLMAHTDIKTTVSHYGHLRSDLAREYVDNFAAKWNPANPAAEASSNVAE